VQLAEVASTLDDRYGPLAMFAAATGRSRLLS
jgi:hypothetical protein